MPQGHEFVEAADRRSPKVDVLQCENPDERVFGEDCGRLHQPPAQVQEHGRTFGGVQMVGRRLRNRKRQAGRATCIFEEVRGISPERAIVAIDAQQPLHFSYERRRARHIPVCEHPVLQAVEVKENVPDPIRLGLPASRHPLEKSPPGRR